MLSCPKLLHPDLHDPASLKLTSEIRAVGSVVRATCANKTVAILECQPNLLWNGTLPSCSDSDGGLSNLSSILIIVWVIGGVLLFTLIVLIAIIIGSRSKPVRRVNGQPPTEVFHISGQGEGGDNPAFSRSEERCGSTSRLASPDSNTRLPSYQEAIRGLYGGRPSPSAPTSSSNPSASSTTTPEPYFIRTNAPPSYRSSHLFRATNIRTSPSHAPTPTTTYTSVNELPSNSNNRQRLGTSTTSTGFRRPPTPGVTRSSTNNNTQHQPPSDRYAESYPQCLWDEDPPPPYTPGPNNIHLYRSPVRTSTSRPAIRRSLTSRRSTPPPPPSNPPPSSLTPSAQENYAIPGQTTTNPATHSTFTTTASHNPNTQHRHSNHPTNNQTTEVASVEHPLITYSEPCSIANGTTGHFSTIHVTNGRQRQNQNSNNFNSLPFPPIQPTNQTSSVHSMLPMLGHNPLLGPPLSSSTPVPVRRDINIPSSTTPSAPLPHVPLPPPPHTNTMNHQQHSRSQSHGSDPRSNPAQNIPHQPRPLPRPRPQPSVHHQRQQSAPLARLEVEYF